MSVPRTSKRVECSFSALNFTVSSGVMHGVCLISLLVCVLQVLAIDSVEEEHFDDEGQFVNTTKKTAGRTMTASTASRKSGEIDIAWCAVCCILVLNEHCR